MIGRPGNFEMILRSGEPCPADIDAAIEGRRRTIVNSQGLLVLLTPKAHGTSLHHHCLDVGDSCSAGGIFRHGDCVRILRTKVWLAGRCSLEGDKSEEEVAEMVERQPGIGGGTVPANRR